MAIVEKLFGSWGHVLVAVAIVGEFKQDGMYGLFTRTKISGCCGEVAISGGSTVIKNNQNSNYTTSKVLI